LKPRVLFEECADRVFKVGLAVEVEDHSWDQLAKVVIRGLDPRIHLIS
jgi:hypothetical protein